MLLIRPARLEDVDALLALAEGAGVGLTTLPPDRRLLRERVVRSQHAFGSEPTRPAGEAYLLVLEDLRTGGIAGTCGLVSKVGGFEPFYTYALQTTVHASNELAVRREVPTLHLERSHSGPSEIGTLFLAPEWRRGGNGRLLSLSRFVFMACFPARFDRTVIAEMRGVLDAQGNSPFWEAVGRHFFDMEFARADVLSAADKTFIADLMPKHPIYTPMLPHSVQAVIGRVHAETAPALRLLEQEGFRFGDHVDIFDGGPLYVAERDAIRTVRESRAAVVADIVPELGLPETFLIANARVDFRCVLGHLRVIEPDADGAARVVLPRDLALALGVRTGERVRYVAARPEAERPLSAS